MAIDKDVIVVGAGFAGLYSVHKLRNELGLDVQAFDAGGGPGGTWWWNRYPGARCDFESIHYQYSFSDEVQRDWEWTERFAGQPEILRYLEFVAEKYDLLRSFRFRTRVISVVWDDEGQFWTVSTDDGASTTARYVVSGAGSLSAAKHLEFTGLEDFRGQVLRTNEWPAEPVDLTGKRVGVIGTGSTGIQVIPEVAKVAAHLTVFQRTAQFASPLGNEPVEPEQRRWLADNHEQVRAGSRMNFLGAPYERPRPSALMDSPEERRKTYDEFYGKGGFRILASTYGDLLFNKASNDTIADYLRDRIRDRVDDPKTADLLCPTDHPYGTKRAPFETGYFEVYNRDNVELVDVSSSPIERLTETGLKTATGEYELDIVILATGFDVFTGPLMRLGIVGRDGLTLEERWADGPRGYTGLQMHGFPNLFVVAGPLSATALYNNALSIEDHVDWIHGAIRHVREQGATTIEPTVEAEQAWGELCSGLVDLTLLPQAASTWYMGDNIVGKPRVAYVFPGGAPLYRAITDQITDRGYGGFSIDGSAVPVPPLVRLDPAVAVVMSGMLNPDYKPLELCTVEETRAQFEAMAMLQIPGPDMRVENLEDPRVRVYVPGETTDEPRPVIVEYHGGGWIAGSVDAVDNTCRSVAERTGAIVVSVDYRLAPEHPFPAPYDDSVAALRWTYEHIAEFGGDPGSIVVMGDSAGGNLAASVAVHARDTGIPLAGQILMYPAIDPAADTVSRQEFADGPVVSATAGDLMWGAYLAGHDVTPQAAPGRVADLSGLAPALVITAEIDPLRDEGEDYARAMRAAGVPVEQHRLDGLIHGVFGMSAVVPRVAEIYEAVGRFVAASARSGQRV
ncbi:flavin-containing monooxygenase [Pseudonocardia oroxyli]|uniref:Predicted flavoprotein CzcO associated with the cation diffusion facilitator CzcD n=1 Tax=Pseudonocardia oroxyli TaxID=366584 RepID=A0A1G8DWK7_PSEOR|nr:alpha/beta hydrolase fold domain-containing protein [Pseudonocardia oroxyli]SDH61948.1 Predicted flavoprotein CzcO associated with the cation diffusion facilitator CzcD [Pseudonocardia oroxyli]